MLFHTSPGFANQLRRGTHFKHLLVIFALAVAAAACDGPVGPQGDQGAQGPEGPAGQDGADGSDGQRGPRGPAGEDGQDGNANVIYSEWAFLQHAVRDTLVDGSHMKVSHITAPEVTSEILDQGLIMVYMKFSNTVYALPYISDAGGQSSEINFRSRVGKIFITRYAFSDCGCINIGGSLQFRYILIPGGVPTGNLQGGLRAQPVDYGDYDAILAYYGIPEEGAGHIPLSH